MLRTLLHRAISPIARKWSPRRRAFLRAMQTEMAEWWGKGEREDAPAAGLTRTWRRSDWLYLLDEAPLLLERYVEAEAPSTAERAWLARRIAGTLKSLGVASSDGRDTYVERLATALLSLANASPSDPDIATTMARLKQRARAPKMGWRFWELPASGQRVLRRELLGWVGLTAEEAAALAEPLACTVESIDRLVGNRGLSDEDVGAVLAAWPDYQAAQEGEALITTALANRYGRQGLLHRFATTASSTLMRQEARRRADPETFQRILNDRPLGNEELGTAVDEWLSATERTEPLADLRLALARRVIERALDPRSSGGRLRGGNLATFVRLLPTLPAATVPGLLQHDDRAVRLAAIQKAPFARPAGADPQWDAYRAEIAGDVIRDLDAMGQGPGR